MKKYKTIADVMNDYKTVDDLNRQQIIELKQMFITELVNNNDFSRFTQLDYDEPTFADWNNADNLISDDVVYEHYDGVLFTDDDFFCSTKI